MRSGAWLLIGVGAALAASACSGGYPLSPTRCDEWCDATKGEQCPEYYNPAGCVSQCEQEDRGRDSCAAELAAVIACFRNTRGAAEARCSYSLEMFPCTTETVAHYNCINPPYYGPGYPL